MAEVQLWRLAAYHAASRDVKEFCQRAIDDHGTANRELMAWVEQKGITAVPTALDRKHQQEAARLVMLQDAALDRTYMQQMMKEHEEDVKRFRIQAKQSKDPELKLFADNTLSMLETYLNIARNLAQQER